MSDSPNHSKAGRLAFKVTLIYLVVAELWDISSNTLLRKLVSNADEREFGPTDAGADGCHAHHSIRSPRSNSASAWAMSVHAPAPDAMTTAAARIARTQIIPAPSPRYAGIRR